MFGEANNFMDVKSLFDVYITHRRQEGLPLIPVYIEADNIFRFWN